MGAENELTRIWIRAIFWWKGGTPRSAWWGGLDPHLQGGRQWVDHRMMQINLLLSQQDDVYATKKNQSDFTVSTTYLHQAVKDPLLVIEKQWTSWDGRFPMHMLLYTIPVKQQRDCYWKWRLTSSNNVKSSKNPGRLGGCVYKQLWTSNQGRTGCSRKQHQEHCCMLSQVEIG